MRFHGVKSSQDNHGCDNSFGRAQSLFIARNMSRHTRPSPIVGSGRSNGLHTNIKSTVKSSFLHGVKSRPVPTFLLSKWLGAPHSICISLVTNITCLELGDLLNSSWTSLVTHTLSIVCVHTCCTCCGLQIASMATELEALDFSLLPDNSKFCVDRLHTNIIHNNE